MADPTDSTDSTDLVDPAAAREELFTRLLVERFGTPPRRRRPPRRPVSVVAAVDPKTRGRRR